MKSLRRVFMVVVAIALAFCVVPVSMLLFGVVDQASFFHRPPAAKIVALHCDHNIRNEDGSLSMRITSQLKTHNMQDGEIACQMVFLHKDGAPLLSKGGMSDMSFINRVKSCGNDSLITIVTNIGYDELPEESLDQSILCKMYLSYKEKDEMVKHKQRKSLKLKNIRDLMDYGK